MYIINELLDFIRNGSNRSSFNDIEELRNLKILLSEKSSSDPDSRLHNLEDTWINGISNRTQESPDRDYAHKRGNALHAFIFYLKLGFYPPPEVLLSMYLCIEQYLGSAGKISLDEVFFNSAHKERSSFAYKHDQTYGHFAMFHVFWNGVEEFLVDPNLDKLNEIDRAVAFLENRSLLNEKGEVYEPESFLRSYRRWKKRKFIQ